MLIYGNVLHMQAQKYTNARMHTHTQTWPILVLLKACSDSHVTGH